MGHIAFGADTFAAAPQLEIVSRFGAGYDTIDLAAATEAGVVVTNTPNAIRRHLGLAALTMLLSVAHNVVAKDAMTRRSDPYAVGVLTPEETARRSAEAMLAGDQASLAAGVELVERRAGVATATMAVRDDMVNGHDIAHGGYVFLLADTAFAVACNSYGQSTVAAWLRHHVRRAGGTRATC